nr:hypothetical protein [Tanacetum cinerariifolium]
MDTMTNQQVAMDEALVPHARRLRIGRSNFHLLSDISSKESTLLLVYDVLHLTPFFKAFLVEHKDTKKSNKMYYPRFTKVIIHHFMSKDPLIPRRNKVNWHYVRDDHMFTMIKMVSRHQNTQQFDAMLPIELTNADIRNYDAYKEYCAVATGATPPKTKASVRKMKSSFDTTVTPPLTAAAGPRLSTFEKGKQPAKVSKAKNEGTGIILGVLDVPTEESDEVISWKSSDEEGDDDDDDEGDDGDDEQASNEEGNDEENIRTNVDREERQDEEDEEDELYKDVNINLGRGTTYQMDVQTPTLVAPLPGSAPTLTPSTIATSDRLRDEAQVENEEFLKTIDKNIQKIIKEQVKEQVKVQVSKILPKIKQTINEQLEAKVLTRSSNSSKTSYAVAIDLSEMELRKILIEKMEGNKSIHRSNEQRNLYKALVEAYESDKIILDTYKETLTLKRCRDDDADKGKEPFAGSDRGSKRRREGKEPESASAPKEKVSRSVGKSIQGSKSRQTSTSESATAEEPMQTTHEMEEPSHLEFETDRDWNKTLPATYGSIQPWISELAKQTDSRSSFNKLMDTPVDFSAFLMNRLKVDTLTPELLAGPTYELMKGSCKSLQYPHNMLKPLPLIPNSQGRRVIPFDHFINNDLEYLCGGASSHKYTTSVTKTKAADYGHIKWIEDLVPRTMWIQEPIGYDKHALWEISHWGRKRQQFYGLAVNRESAHDVYSKRRIIAVTELKIFEWHNYKHLDWITVRRDDDKLYKFKEGDFKRLRIQDIEDMLLLLVQGKLTNPTVEERFAFNKKLNLTRPDTYRSDLKCKEAYIAYSNPRGFIYHNKDKQNRLMRIDELHKFSDGMLSDVRTALDDRLKGFG